MDTYLNPKPAPRFLQGTTKFSFALCVRVYEPIGGNLRISRRKYQVLCIAVHRYYLVSKLMCPNWITIERHFTITDRYFGEIFNSAMRAGLIKAEELISL